MPRINDICDSYVDSFTRLYPTVATELGLVEHDGDLPDFSPDGHAERARLVAASLAAAADAETTDDAERAARAVFVERLSVDRELHDAGLRDAALNVLASPPQEVRAAFDLMPTDSEEAWGRIAERLGKVPACLTGYAQALAAAAANGVVSAKRQVTRVAEQCDVWSGATDTPSFFATFVESAPVSDALRADLDSGAAAAAKAYADLAAFLRTELLDLAPAKDAVGEDTYRLWSREFLGAALDLREAYEWGWAEFTSLTAEMREVADRIKPGATVAEAAAVLDRDPRYQVADAAEFRGWLQRLSDQALADLRGVHFEIPDDVMRLDCRISPPGGPAGAYYTPPTADFSRPGAMWWTLPPDKTEFTTWRELSTVYHEGVPGHHMQIATAVYEAERLNKFQRLIAWVPGYGEGWALYAERLMREFGYLTDDGFLLGMLNEHVFRAARVIIDIGMHLELEIPRGAGFHDGERWTPELGLEFMLTRTLTEAPVVRDEVDRYLGWAGQAPAYKLGERLWLAAREDAMARDGAAFDLKDFHMRALRMGPMGLDTLRERLAAAR
jgi:uncharacterized protein (DUF885 family)